MFIFKNTNIIHVKTDIWAASYFVWEGFEVQYGDENDPQSANRIRAPSIVPRQKGYILESKDAFVRPRPVTASGAQR